MILYYSEFKNYFKYLKLYINIFTIFYYYLIFYFMSTAALVNKAYKVGYLKSLIVSPIAMTLNR